MNKEIILSSEKEFFVITKFGEDDFSLWITEDLSNTDSGYSTRGNAKEILVDIFG